MRKLALAAMCAAGTMVAAGQASAAVVDFEDLAPGFYGSQVVSGGLHVGGGGGHFDVITSSDPAATGSSGQEAFFEDGGVGNPFRILGSALYISVDLNGAAGETLTIGSAFVQPLNSLTQTLVLDDDLSTFQTLFLPAPLVVGFGIFISSNSGPFTVDNVVYSRPASLGAVPEPASWALMIAGFGMAGAGLRRRRVSY